MKKGYYGQYTGNARHSHTRVTSENYADTQRDDEAHMQYLKEDINYDAKHGGSDKQMTSDEKHISKLAGDLKHDEKKHGEGPHMDYSPMTMHCNSAARYNAPMKMVSPVEFHEGVSHNRTVLGQKYSLGAENYADSVRVAKREQKFNEMMKPKMTRTITNMPYTEEQLKARNESIKKSEAQELPRIKRK